MAKASEQFRQSDVVRWGVVALVSCAVAVLAANVSALLPRSVLSSLHSSRVEGVSIEQLRVAVAAIEGQSLDLRNQNRTLLARFAQQEREAGQAIRRIGALEVTLPRLVEQQRTDPIDVDRSLPTASIGDPSPETGSIPTDGGSVRIQTSPLVLTQPAPLAQPIPAPLEDISQEATATLPALGSLKFGVALGPSIGADVAAESWANLQNDLGTLLLGLSPVLASETNSGDFRIIAGPTGDVAQARALCDQFATLSIPCEPMPYIGLPLN